MLRKLAAAKAPPTSLWGGVPEGASGGKGPMHRLVGEEKEVSTAIKDRGNRSPVPGESNTAFRWGTARVTPQRMVEKKANTQILRVDRVVMTGYRNPLLAANIEVGRVNLGKKKNMKPKERDGICLQKTPEAWQKTEHRSSEYRVGRHLGNTGRRLGEDDRTTLKKQQ